MLQLSCDKEHDLAEGDSDDKKFPAIARVVHDNLSKSSQDLCANHLQRFFEKEFKEAVKVIPAQVIMLLGQEVGKK